MWLLTALTVSGLQIFSVTSSVPNDYIPRDPFVITFPPGSRRQLYYVTIVDDALPEKPEFFNADVNNASPKGVILGKPKQPLIEVQDFILCE